MSNDVHGEDGDTIGTEELQRIAKKTIIFIDTSALLNPGARKVLARDLAACLMRAHRKARVLSRTIDHLENSKGSANSPDHGAATRAVRFLKKMQAVNVVEEIADPAGFTEQGFATRRTFALMFFRYQISQNFARGQTLITNDEATARQIYTNGQLEAIKLSASSPNLYYVGDRNLKLWAPRLPVYANSAPHHSAPSTRELKTIAHTCKIMVDTCSLMRSSKDDALTGARYFSNVLLPLMREVGNPLFVPDRVVRELKVKQGRSETVVAAAAGLAVLDLFEAEGLLVLGEHDFEIEGTSENFADPVFVQIAIKFSADHDLCFITQDTNLAIALIANRQPGRGHATHVVYLDDRASLVRLEAWEPRLKRI